MGNEYTLLWKEIIPGSEFSKRFWVEDQIGFLPFYVNGHDYFRLRDNQEVKLNEFMLLQGLLFSYNDLDPNGNSNKELFYDLLLRLYWGFHKNSLATAIMDVSTKLREEYSLYPSYRVLKSGVTLIPTNTDIRMDYILSIWNLINENPQTPELMDYLSEVVGAFKNLDVKVSTTSIIMNWSFI